MSVGAYWSDANYSYWDYWIYADTKAERENLLKLKQMEVRKDANQFHYKGEGYRLVDMTVDRRKTSIHLQCRLERTKQKKFKGKKGKK